MAETTTPGWIRHSARDPVADRQRVRELRAHGVKDACAILGVAELQMLGYLDSTTAGTPANRSYSRIGKTNPAKV